MARWKLMTSHYLNTADHTEWEYKEIDTVTGREIRRRRRVPRYLDILDPADWTNQFGDAGVSRGGKGPDGQGEIIVCYEDRGRPTDIIFYGDPTPDMSPIDDEAREISAGFEDHWRYKPESAEISYSQSQAERLTAEAQAKADAPPVIPGLEALVNALGQMVQQNQEIIRRFDNNG